MPYFKLNALRGNDPLLFPQKSNFFAEKCNFYLKNISFLLKMSLFPKKYNVFQNNLNFSPKTALLQNNYTFSKLFIPLIVSGPHALVKCRYRIKGTVSRNFGIRFFSTKQLLLVPLEAFYFFRILAELLAFWGDSAVLATPRSPFFSCAEAT